METRRIGSVDVPVAGVGCNAFGLSVGEDEVLACVDAGIDAGATHFDPAESYSYPGGSSEEFIGAALGKRRDQVVLTTKVLSGDPVRVAEAIDASLRRLRTDHVDLYLLHMP